MNEWYQYVRNLGNGAFGEVSLYYNDRDARYEAVKRISLKSQRFKREEIDHHVRVLPHPNIIELNDYKIDDVEDVAYISLAHAPSGDMLEIVRSMVMIEPIACFYFKQLLDAVEHCHARNVVHSDIKLENLLLDGFTLKLCDFGYSQPRDRYDYTRVAGTPVYLAPEIVRKRPHDGTKADVWACGIALHCMVCGNYPYENWKDINLLISDIVNVRLKIFEKLTPACRDFMSRIFVPDPAQRASIRDLRAHPWIGERFA